MSQWERESGKTLPPHKWLSLVNALTGHTACYSHVEAHRKLMYRWYLTPDRLNKIYPNTSDRCLRCQTQRGTMLHTWWGCYLIQPLWLEVIRLLSKVGINLPQEFEACLWLDLPTSWRKQEKALATQVILAARALIAINWKSTNCLSETNLMDKIRLYYVYNISSAITASQKYKISQNWEPWCSQYQFQPP
ncbi:Hypothetical predicted protein [Pelobates cultripes]|uniref:Uncharacterized protein n=1 Tax=Pelobates cultripes TaxID=61616 RepID=A0AAD1VUM4_PELCU|nr:Hypothetical predicted protein [Pelobates cultripes]